MPMVLLGGSPPRRSWSCVGERTKAPSRLVLEEAEQATTEMRPRGGPPAVAPPRNVSQGSCCAYRDGWGAGLQAACVLRGQLAGQNFVYSIRSQMAITMQCRAANGEKKHGWCRWAMDFLHLALRVLSTAAAVGRSQREVSQPAARRSARSPAALPPAPLVSSSRAAPRRCHFVMPARRHACLRVCMPAR